VSVQVGGEVLEGRICHRDTVRSRRA
jgi:hypothetical protein